MIPLSKEATEASKTSLPIKTSKRRKGESNYFLPEGAQTIWYQDVNNFDCHLREGS